MNRRGRNPVTENRPQGVIRLSVLEFGDSFFSVVCQSKTKARSDLLLPTLTWIRHGNVNDLEI